MADAASPTISNNLRHQQHKGLLSWLSPDAASYLYTVFFRRKWIRGLFQSIVKLFIPKDIELKGVTICLNKSDAIVSGALALGCYETHMLDYFVDLIQPGMTVVDIGANIGLYTVLSAKSVGESGKVIAIEPEATNCSFITASLAVNKLSNAVVHQKALSDKNGELELFLCDSNNADHRIYNASEGSTSLGRKSIKIPTARLDDLLGPELINHVDIIKMDIQGAEAIAINGMTQTLSKPKLKMVMEYWPWGLKQAGSDPLKLVQLLRGFGFTIQEFDAKTGEIKTVIDDLEIASRDLERQHANLLLTKS